MEAMWVEPESNQPSSVSVSLVNSVQPHSQAKPSGSSCSASSVNQALEPCWPNSSDTRSMVSGVQTGLPHSSQ